jgi:hypothetical protein
MIDHMFQILSINKSMIAIGRKIQRDFEPTQRFICHSMSSQQSYQHQQQQLSQPGGFFSERQPVGYYSQRQQSEYSQRQPNTHDHQRQTDDYFALHHQNQYNSYRPNY